MEGRGEQEAETSKAEEMPYKKRLIIMGPKKKKVTVHGFSFRRGGKGIEGGEGIFQVVV